jgi:hypothetical protein
VHFAHVPALRSTQTGSPVLRRRRSPSVAVRRRRRPWCPPLSPPGARRRPGVFSVAIGAPQRQTRVAPVVAAPRSRCTRAAGSPTDGSDPIGSKSTEVYRSTAAWPLSFCKKPPVFSSIYNQVLPSYSFLTDRSCFLRFSPESLGFFSD